MKIGDLRHKVTIQSPVQTADGMGGFTRAFVDSDRVFAAIWDTSALEQVRLGKQAESNVTRIRIRYHKTIAADWRIKFGDTYYAINSIINPNRKNEMLDLVCRIAEVE
jgi:SPP1 family predicted phage head-tail adaptor